MYRLGRKTEDDSRSSLIHGAAIMGLAAMASKVLGTMQKIPLQNIAGDRVFGLYNAVYPFYQLLLVLATAGFPVAVSLLVAERAACQDGRGARQVLRVSLWLLVLTGAAVFAGMWFGADLAAGWIGDAAAAPAIRMSALALWTMPAVAALRGYYQGLGRMLPSAMSQLAEQTLRVTAMLLLLMAGWQLGWPDERLAAGATAGSAVGGLAALLMLAVIAMRERRRARRTDSGSAAGGGEGTAVLVKRLAALAFPVALGALAVPMIAVVDALTVPRLLQSGGMDAAAAMTLFGQYSRGQPLVQLVVMVAGAMAAAIVPALAAARQRGDLRAAQEQAALALRIAWCAGSASAIGVIVLAKSMNIMLYSDNEGILVFMLIGSTALAGTINAITAALLPGLGAVRIPALLMLAAAALKAALNAALVPACGIAGAAWAGIAALTAAALLGAAAVRQAAAALGGAGGRSAASAPLRRSGGVVLALAVMAAALVLVERGFAPLLEQWLPQRAAATIIALGGTALGAALFLAAAVRFGGVTARDLRELPGGTSIVRRLQRWRLLPRE
ncbi:oligosaccharide flippase family protein [Paenibacillus sp. GCM10027626]|uniref:oligosaccharide flippase family protein n=1 Tax=Paenibacillus sp. GCM10027626 TaxID=3273411 RepID=UPI003631460B